MRLTIAVSVLFCTVLLGGPAHASPPELLTDVMMSVDDDYAAGEFCPDFAVNAAATQRIVVRGYFKDGELVRTQVHVKGQGTYTHLGTGEQVRDNWSFRETVDLVEGTLSEVGTVFNINARGSGIIVQETGRVVWDVGTGQVLEVHGPHQLLDVESGVRNTDLLDDAVCTVLAS